jgi:hypothetical protein
MKGFILLIMLGLVSTILNSAMVSAQQSGNSSNNSPRCSQPGHRQFDFWLGEWDVRWVLGGEEGKGTNVIRATLDGCVILENFDGTPALPLRGMSISTFNPRSGKWQQTWVDNQGGYLDFVGELKDGRMVLQRKAVINDKEITQRMVWHNITKDRLDWNWERSDDGGKTWKLLWQIHYTRRK